MIFSNAANAINVAANRKRIKENQYNYMAEALSSLGFSDAYLNKQVLF
jgi:hypothetical protein